MRIITNDLLGEILMDNNLLSNMGFTNLQQDSLADKVYNIMEKNIISLEIPPGTNLSESDIAKSFNISRSPVREAFYKLECKGLVKKTSSGRVVSEINKKELINNYQAWKMTESFTAALASKEATEKDIETLNETKNLLENFSDQEMLSEYRKYNYDFHVQLVAPCPNDYLVKIHKNILNRVEWCYNYSISLISDMELSSFLHDKIYNAYVNKKTDKLKKHISEHIDIASERFQKAWDEQKKN